MEDSHLLILILTTKLQESKEHGPSIKTDVWIGAMGQSAGNAASHAWSSDF